jgi:uncharacterized protein (DUF427 family)
MNKLRRMAPKPGQESVWDYPRPPKLDRCSKHIRVVFNGVTIAETYRAIRILETCHPPVYYIPPEDIKREYLTLTNRHTFCEFKGAASYYTITVGDQTVQNAAWFYSEPHPDYQALKNYVAFYASQMEACYVGDEKVTGQEGDFYGGWITGDIVGPYKGGPGTFGW